MEAVRERNGASGREPSALTKEAMEALKEQFPLIHDLVSVKELMWANPRYGTSQETQDGAQGSAQSGIQGGMAKGALPLSQEDVAEAEARLQRFAPYLAKAFPELRESGGIIESPLVEIASLKREMERMYGGVPAGRLLLKCDSHLPVSGSIKARGGIYEVLKHAERLALEHGLLQPGDDYSALGSEENRAFFSRYSVAVGSTGNLGLSIGIIGARLGFKTTVHMSADAKQWKKDLLRSKGVTVIEYESDYSKAVEEGRRMAGQDPKCHFVDDENSADLFLGYATAASRLANQLEAMGVAARAENPLFVYLPCGVGGGPGGVAFGLKLLFGEHVHIFFAEPTHSPCMLLGMLTGLHERISVRDAGIDNVTAADGLAVARPSGFVGRIMEPLLSGIYTVGDSTLYRLLHAIAQTETIYLEPSALAGAFGPVQLLHTAAGQDYLRRHRLQEKMEGATHIVWATGGSMVPKDVMAEYVAKGAELSGETQ